MMFILGGFVPFKKQRLNDGASKSGILNIKARLVNGGEIPKNKFVFGRHVMTCCVEDIQFAGLVCKWSDEAAKFNNGEWVSVTAKVKVEEDPIYGGGPGPVLYCSKVKPASPAIPEVATF